jgi:hypothetical protein
MEEKKTQGLTQKWEDFRPTKGMTAGLVAGAVVLTVGLGFGMAGWVTGGTAQSMAAKAADEARAELAAVICVQNFLASADVGAQMAELKGIDSSFRQRQFIEAGGWATMPNAEAANRQAADLCARALADIELEAALPVEQEEETL